MKLRKHHLLFILPGLFTYFFSSGCNGRPYKEDLKAQKYIYSFEFTTADNPGLSKRAAAGGFSDTILVWFPPGTNVSNLIPTIEFTGKSISPGSKVPGNFSSPVAYEVIAQDGTSQKYFVKSMFF